MPVDEKDIVKAGADAVMAPLKDLLSRLLGPFADEIGGLFADPVRVFRLRRSVKLLEKVKQVLHDAGIDPKVVPLKVILPILEHASLEDSEDLHDRWVNLLANAAAGESSSGYHATFVDILKGLSASDPLLLDLLYDAVDSVATKARVRDRATQLANLDLGDWGEIEQAYHQTMSTAKLSEDTRLRAERAFAMSLDNLLRQGLVWRSRRAGGGKNPGEGITII